MRTKYEHSILTILSHLLGNANEAYKCERDDKGTAPYNKLIENCCLNCSSQFILQT